MSEEDRKLTVNIKCDKQKACLDKLMFSTGGEGEIAT